MDKVDFLFMEDPNDLTFGWFKLLVNDELVIGYEEKELWSKTDIQYWRDGFLKTFSLLDNNSSVFLWDFSSDTYWYKFEKVDGLLFVYLVDVEDDGYILDGYIRSDCSNYSVVRYVFKCDFNCFKMAFLKSRPLMLD